MKAARNLKSEVMRFLRENGWARNISKNKKVLRYQKADSNLNKPVSIYFTISRSDSTPSELEEALSTIRQYYGISFAELRHRIATLAISQARSSAIPRDFVTTRVPDFYVRDDTIDISIAFSTIGYLRSLVEGAAIAEAELEGDFNRAGVRSAKEYSESCRFGHTFRGSFGFQVECPLNETQQLSFDLFEVEKPLGRKVSERISAGMSSLAAAFEMEDAGSIVARREGLTSRMCTDLADFLESSQLSSIRLAVEYDTSLPSSVGTTITDFHVRGASIPLLREATKLLEPEPEERPVNVIGRVVVLKASGRPMAEDEVTKRLVTIHWESGEGARNVQVELSPREYQEAIRAHEGGSHVQAKGSLMKRGNRYTLSDLSSFTVLE